MAKFRYSTDGGTTWTVAEGALPYNIGVTADQDVMVEPIGAAVTNLGTVSGHVLSLVYDASVPTADIQATTNFGGTFYWAITESLTPPSAAAIIAGTGFVEHGSVGTVPGSVALTLPTLDGVTELFFHAVVGNGAERTNVATVRVQIGNTSSWIGISGVTGAPTIYNYTDGDGTWRAWEFTADGSFTVNHGGGLEYELVAGGGGGGGGTSFVWGGGGGAGGVLRGTTTLTPGTYAVVVGAGGAGGTNAARSTSGGNSTAMGLTAVGGGAGGWGNDNTKPQLTGGSGGGARGGSSTGAAGTSGQGNAGGNGQGNSGGGGGGAGGVGGNGSSPASGNPAGAGGAGITSTIIGTTQQIAGGGGGSGGTGGTASHGGGAGMTNASGSNTPGGAATAVGAGGGAGNGNGNTPALVGGNGYRGRFVVRIKL